MKIAHSYKDDLNELHTALAMQNAFDTKSRGFFSNLISPISGFLDNLFGDPVPNPTLLLNQFIAKYGDKAGQFLADSSVKDITALAQQKGMPHIAQKITSLAGEFTAKAEESYKNTLNAEDQHNLQNALEKSPSAKAVEMAQNKGNSYALGA